MRTFSHTRSVDSIVVAVEFVFADGARFTGGARLAIFLAFYAFFIRTQLESVLTDFTFLSQTLLTVGTVFRAFGASSARVSEPVFRTFVNTLQNTLHLVKIMSDFTGLAVRFSSANVTVVNANNYVRTLAVFDFISLLTFSALSGGRTFSTVFTTGCTGVVISIQVGAFGTG